MKDCVGKSNPTFQLVVFKHMGETLSVSVDSDVYISIQIVNMNLFPEELSIIASVSFSRTEFTLKFVYCPNQLNLYKTVFSTELIVLTTNFPVNDS